MNFGLFLLALIPIIWLIIALAVMKMPGYQACLIALVIGAVIAMAAFNSSGSNVATAALEGVLNALWPIILVIIAALFTYNITLETGAMDKIKAMLASVSTDQRILLLIIAWGFGNFMEGMAGFGTAVAIPASILVGLGFDPIPTVVACLVINSTPTAFGSVGVPTTTMAAVTGLSATSLSANVALIECVIMFISPIIAVMILGKGAKAMKGVWGITIVSSLAFTLPCFIVGRFVGAELPNIVGSIVCMAVTILMARKMRDREVPQEYSTVSDASQLSTEKLTFGSAVNAWLPFILIFVILVITSSLVPFIHDPLSKIASAVTIYNGKGASPLTFTWINTPGVLFFIAAIIGGLAQGAKGSTLGRVFVKTVTGNWKTIVTICSVLALAKIMTHSGMTGEIAAVLVAATGTAFPIISPLIGTIGAFVTGSGTSTSVLFGDLQRQTAQAIGANPAWLCAANELGAGIGKMISPQGIAIGTSAVALAGSESVVLRKVAKYCLLFVVIAGVICYVFPMIGLVIH
jgi:lactate permease